MLQERKLKVYATNIAKNWCFLCQRYKVKEKKMRKLIIATIILVIAMIAWISYQKYDTKRFIEELPLSSNGEKQQLNDTEENSTVKDSEETLQDDGANTKQSQPENTPADLQDRKSENVGQDIVTDTNTERNSGSLESAQTSISTGLSPEVVKLYSELSVIYDEYVKVSKEYKPLSEQMSENTKRYNNYGQEYKSAFGNIEKVDELEAEYDDLVAWLKVNTPIYQSLHTDVQRLSEKMKTFLSSRGISSDEFDWKAYATWHNKQKMDESQW